MLAAHAPDRTAHDDDGGTAIDLRWIGLARCIAVWRVGDVLIDCGPRVCADALVDALGAWRPKALLLTHIHFDHAGAAGSLVARWPDLRVFVHRRGAKHLVAPERLEASARRVFGAAFDERYGTLTPIPEGNVAALDGGEDVHGFRVAATPGHASHHLAFLHGSGRAFVGDVAGVRLDPQGPILLPTPPPDIDLDAWDRSLDAIGAWDATSLALTHFGAVEDPAEHLGAVRGQLQAARRLAVAPRDVYVASLRDRLRSLPEERRVAYEAVVPPEQNHVGLQRWTAQHRPAG